MDNGGFVDLSHFGAELMLAKTLFDYGARTPVVCALCGIKRITATRIYRLAQEQAPIKGMLPWDPHWISRSTINNLHASIFLGLIQDYVSFSVNDTEFGLQFCNAYTLYCRIVARNPKPSNREAGFEHHRVLDINRAWQLTRQFHASALHFVMCLCCQSRFLIPRQADQQAARCPVCENKTGSVARQHRISRPFSQNAGKTLTICLDRF
ncbi:MAG: flagellar transcriptional regulator FlhC [Methylomonas sp.]|uniref:FlhC family transcriptional regulator n=1 Tax=Methylomonas sp. TaxID=418 RepID=UPI0025F61EA6|nr:FlhC family transcriptional regulator [Methylomonas sp.]MCK9609046.1 flagellar transcriptional regulator FlhC [Methylomonas sp.]